MTALLYKESLAMTALLQHENETHTVGTQNTIVNIVFLVNVVSFNTVSTVVKFN